MKIVQLYLLRYLDLIVVLPSRRMVARVASRRERPNKKRRRKLQSKELKTMASKLQGLLKKKTQSHTSRSNLQNSKVQKRRRSLLPSRSWARREKTRKC